MIPQEDKPVTLFFTCNCSSAVKPVSVLKTPGVPHVTPSCVFCARPMVVRAVSTAIDERPDPFEWRTS